MPDAKKGQVATVKRSLAGHLQGQVAMEYLATYGWSLLALFFVLGMLAASGIFNPGRFASEECTIQPSMPCGSYFIFYNTTSHVLNASIQVANGVGAPVLWRNATITMSDNSGTINGWVYPVPNFTYQGETTYFNFSWNNVQSFRTSGVRVATLNISFSSCEGYADMASCASPTTGAPVHYSAGKISVVPRQAK